jgi:hypothetical protein
MDLNAIIGRLASVNVILSRSGGVRLDARARADLVALLCGDVARWLGMDLEADRVALYLTYSDRSEARRLLDEAVTYLVPAALDRDDDDEAKRLVGLAVGLLFVTEEADPNPEPTIVDPDAQRGEMRTWHERERLLRDAAADAS